MWVKSLLWFLSTDRVEPPCEFSRVLLQIKSPACPKNYTNFGHYLINLTQNRKIIHWPATFSLYVFFIISLFDSTMDSWNNIRLRGQYKRLKSAQKPCLWPLCVFSQNREHIPPGIPSQSRNFVKIRYVLGVTVGTDWTHRLLETNTESIVF